MSFGRLPVKFLSEANDVVVYTIPWLLVIFLFQSRDIIVVIGYARFAARFGVMVVPVSEGAETSSWPLVFWGGNTLCSTMTGPSRPELHTYLQRLYWSNKCWRDLILRLLSCLKHPLTSVACISLCALVLWWYPHPWNVHVSCTL